MTPDMRTVLEIKILLEAELMSPLWLASRRYIASWERGGGAMSAFERMGHKSDLEQVLHTHYARVVMVMTGRAPPRRPTLASAALSLQHMDSLRQRASIQSGLILQSIDNALAGVMSRPSEGDGQGLDNYAKSAETKADPVSGFQTFAEQITAAVLKALETLKAKLGLVSNVQTNPVAEEARRVAAEAEARIKTSPMLKRWVSLMDGRERPTHHAGHLDYENAPITTDVPFMIGGFPMMMPGDMSRGAPLKETVNCRCAAVYSLLNPDGTESPVGATPHAPTRPYRRIKPDPATLKPTSIVTLNGTTRARVVLGDGRTTATLRQVTPSTITVQVGGRVVGRAQVVSGTPVNITVDPSFRNQDIEGLIRRSVAHSHGRKPQAVR